MNECGLCKRVQKYIIEGSPWLVHEFENSVLMVGDHQMFPGYCILVLKQHVRELHELNDEINQAYYQEMMIAGRAINEAFSPKKMNYSNYGNMSPHLHWHLFPRRESDKNWPKPPWTLMDEFEENKTTEEQGRAVARAIQQVLNK